MYQAMGFNFVGDSVNFLCLLFLGYGIATRHWIHILENSVLMTLGYILPLLIRNSIKLTYQEAPSMKSFLQLAAVSSSTTLILGLGCTAASFMTYRLIRQVKTAGRSKITTSSSSDDSLTS
ncbi:hypothetical protein AZI86_00780 [Bdellovibrio bacteriovorus]|uniref:Uncharacterized protein n=1 Tax=Bdellovibrio bacteriovorus TaxID=959 RepID=A0A150WT09_BDEBC|nr:hypothetical protein AZI86_00780 [Bdellovibrio bacteriovorus]